MNNTYRNFVKECYEGLITLEEAIFAANNLLVTADADEETTTDEIEYLGEQIDRLNEMCAERFMQSIGYKIDKSGIYIKSAKSIGNSGLIEF